MICDVSSLGPAEWVWSVLRNSSSCVSSLPTVVLVFTTFVVLCCGLAVSPGKPWVPRCEERPGAAQGFCGGVEGVSRCNARAPIGDGVS